MTVASSREPDTTRGTTLGEHVMPGATRAGVPEINAAGEQDQKKQETLYLKYQEAMVDEANLIVLFQPIYRIGVRKTIKDLPLTAAGWQLDIRDVKPAS